MSNRKPYLAKLVGRGLDKTGVTENIARQMTNAKGRRYMAIVEVEVHTIHDKPEQLIADLVTEQFWPIVDDTDLDDHLRDVAAVLHARRGNPDGDQELDIDGPSPKVSDVLARGRQHRPHPYLSSGLAVDDDAVCDVCGHHESAAQHHATAADLDGGDDAEPTDETDGVAVDKLAHNHGTTTDCSPGCPVYDAADDLLATT